MEAPWTEIVVPADPVSVTKAVFWMGIFNGTSMNVDANALHLGRFRLVLILGPRDHILRFRLQWLCRFHGLYRFLAKEPLKQYIRFCYGSPRRSAAVFSNAGGSGCVGAGRSDHDRPDDVKYIHVSSPIRVVLDVSQWF